MRKLVGWIKLVHLAKQARKYHAIPVLALAIAVLIAGEKANRREEQVIGEAFILAEIENVVKFLSGAA